MLRAKRPVLASVLATSMALSSVMPLSAQAADWIEEDRPGEMAMIGDAVFARPVLLASTVVGAGLWLVTLPFSALGGNVGESGKVLVMNPGKATFLRCLGCTPAQHEALRSEKRSEQQQERVAGSDS